MMNDVTALLRRHGIQPTPQRIALARVTLETTEHPSADRIWERVREEVPTVSRATVYNTLNLFVEKGLLRTQILKEGTVIFDPHTEPHHHFIDEATGRIYDVPWEALSVRGSGVPEGFEAREYQVVIRGRRKK